MKKIFSLALVAAVCATMTISCNKNGSDPVTPQEDSLSMLLGMGNGSALASQVMQDSTNEIDKDAFIRGFEEAINADTSVVGRSYDIGRMQGQRMRQQFDMMKQQLGVNVSYSTFLKSFEKTFKGKPLDDIKMAKLQEDFNAIIQKIQAEQEAKRNALANNNLKAGEAYLNKAVKEGMTKTQSGIAYKMLAQGNGDNFKDGDVVMVKYKGTLIDGTVFDEQTAAVPMRIADNELIKGFIETLKMMRPGAKCKAIIPANLAYGLQGAPNPYTGEDKIGPNQTLVFELETVGLQPQEEGEEVMQ